MTAALWFPVLHLLKQEKQIRFWLKIDIRIDGKKWLRRRFGHSKTGNVAVSPIITNCLYGSLLQCDWKQKHREVFVMNADGSNNKQITLSIFRKWCYVIKGGSKIAFLSSESGAARFGKWIRWHRRNKLPTMTMMIEGFSFSHGRKDVVLSHR